MSFKPRLLLLLSSRSAFARHSRAAFHDDVGLHRAADFVQKTTTNRIFSLSLNEPHDFEWQLVMKLFFQCIIFLIFPKMSFLSI